MCLAIPGMIVRWIDRTEPFAMAEVEFAGVRRPVAMSFCPEAKAGDYVLVHAGMAISRIDAAEAEETLRMLREMGEPEVDAGGDNG